MLNMADSNSFFDLFSVFLETIDHLDLKLLIFIGILQVLRYVFQKVEDFGNFELSPMLSHMHKLTLSTIIPCYLQRQET